jgi:hypothetical protein
MSLAGDVASFKLNRGWRGDYDLHPRDKLGI